MAINKIHKPLLLILGWFFFILGLVGVFLPLLPTTPFMLLAAYFFSKSSKKLHQWLRHHRIFGTTIRQWEEHRVISPKAKTISTLMIIALFSYTLIYVNVTIVIKSIITLIGLCVLIFILTRSSYPQD